MEFLNDIPLIGPALGWVLPFLIVLSVVVAIHELGHLMVGRWCGIRAEVFSIGFGPVLAARTDSHGTSWQLAALPLGGYVKFVGDMDPASVGAKDDDDLTPEERRGAFHNAALWRRALTVLAGPVANFILTVVILTGYYYYQGRMSDEPVIAELGSYTTKEIGFMRGDRIVAIGDRQVDSFGQAIELLFSSDGAPTEVTVLRDGREVSFTTEYLRPPEVSGMTADGAALAAGVRLGDEIVKIEGQEIRSLAHLQRVISNLPLNKEINFVVDRDGREIAIAFTPNVRERRDPFTQEVRPMPTLGINLDIRGGIASPMEGINFVEALSAAGSRVWMIVRDTMVFIHAMIFEGADTSQLSGPIGIAKHSANAATQGFGPLLVFMAFVSTAIGLFNLFPIPVLDGGHLCFYLYEWIRGRPTNDAVVRYSTMAGLSLLLLLMVFVTFNNDLGLGDWLRQQ